MNTWCFWCLGGETGEWGIQHPASSIEHSASGGRVALSSFNLKNNSTFALDVYI
jgi:hypothetical protein